MTRAERQENWAALEDRIGLALGCAASASASEPGHPPSAACDGNLDVASYWGATPYPAWWQVDLGRERLIDRVRVVTYWDSGATGRSYQYLVKGSPDGKSWVTLADRGGNAAPAARAGDLVTFTPLRARYVRVEMLHNSANVGVHLVEVQVLPAVEAPVASAPAQCEPAWTAEGQTGAAATDMGHWGHIGAERIVLQGKAIQRSGDRIRLTFRGGATGGISIGELSIGLTDPANDADLRPQTRVPVTFGGMNRAELPPGQAVATDWVRFPLEAGRDCTVTFDVLSEGAATLWSDGRTVRFESAPGSAALPRWSSTPHATTYNLYFLSRLEVPK